MDFKEKVVIITGASSGIGRATAIQFAELNASLVLAGRDEEKLQSVAEECRKINDLMPLIVTAELSIENEVKRIIDVTIEKHQKIHVLVNNAGTMELGSVEFANLEQFDTVFRVNVRAAFQLCTLAIPYLIASKGSIVNVSSINAIRPYPFSMLYNVSKAALDHMTKCMSVELAYRGVRVNGISPGLIKTNFLKKASEGNTLYAQMLDFAKSTQPLGRMGAAEEVARAIVFLASEDSFFINGVILPVDGGRTNL